MVSHFSSKSDSTSGMHLFARAIAFTNLKFSIPQRVSMLAMLFYFLINNYLSALAVCHTFEQAQYGTCLIQGALFWYSSSNDFYHPLIKLRVNNAFVFSMCFLPSYLVTPCSLRNLNVKRSQSKYVCMTFSRGLLIVSLF